MLTEESVTGAATGPLVLVIENDPKATNLLRIYLTEAGYAVEVAKDGEEGIEKVKRVRPGAVLLDVLLPKISGWEVLTRLKADPMTQAIPIVIVSIVDEQSKGMALGADAYVMKPIAKEELLGKLNAVWQDGSLPRMEQ
jgi:DNA-binding response OmpR family regulator